MGNDLGVFEAMANAGKLSAEAAANSGFELEKSIDRAIFRAKERFGAYLANSQSKSDWNERWSQVSNEVIKVIAEVTTPTPKVIRRVGAALRPQAQAQAPVKKTRPSSTKIVNKTAIIGDAPLAVTSSIDKTAWAYDQTTKLYTSKDPMQKFACPGCGTEQDQLGFVHCAGEGCNRTWNSWPVRQQSSAKTGASTYILMAREIKMRGDQFKMAAAGNVSTLVGPLVTIGKFEIQKSADAPMPQEPPPGMSQPSFGTMPGDNSAAMGTPMPPEQPPTPGGDPDGDQDIAGGVTEGSPIDQIQDALQDAVGALKDVQMLSINPQLSAMGSVRVKKVAALHTAMDRFWVFHKEMNYIAGQLAEEAKKAIREVDPRITSESQFIAGYNAAANNMPLPAKTARAWLEGYVAFHKRADDYNTGTDIGRVTVPGADRNMDESNGARNDGSYLGGDGLDDGTADTSDAGPFDTSQPAQQDSARQIDEDNAAGGRDRGQGQSGSIQPTGARKPLPKNKR